MQREVQNVRPRPSGSPTCTWCLFTEVVFSVNKHHVQMGLPEGQGLLKVQQRCVSPKSGRKHIVRVVFVLPGGQRDGHMPHEELKRKYDF